MREKAIELVILRLWQMLPLGARVSDGPTFRQASYLLSTASDFPRSILTSQQLHEVRSANYWLVLVVRLKL
jgi:hypothetical protein